jgi:hypothetical protein
MGPKSTVFRTFQAKFQVPSRLKEGGRRQFIPSTTHLGAHLKESQMNPSIKSRAAALVASVLVTFATVYTMAEYAYPEAPATQLASAAP